MTTNKSGKMTSLLLWKSLLNDRGAAKAKKLIAETNMKLCENVSLCRICDEENGVIPIFQNTVYPNITQEIYSISGVRMDQSDDLSKYICENCLNLLNGCIMFREMCRKSNKMMFEINVKRERNVKPVFYNNTECNDIGHQDEWDTSYNMPSPSYSDKSTKNSWTFDKHTDLVRDSIKESTGGLVVAAPTSDPKKFSNIRRKLPRRPKREPRGDRASYLMTCLCDVCGKLVTFRSLPGHMATHTGIFPYKCNKCPYRGGSKDLLTTHKKTHLSKDELPCRCTKCPTAMATASNLAKHMRTMHGRHKRPTKPTNKSFKCDLCESAFTYKADMKRHIIQTHENAKHGTIECEICLNQFSTKHILLEHQISVHKLKRKAKGLGRIPAYLIAQLE